MSTNQNQDQIFSSLVIKDTLASKKIICQDIICKSITTTTTNNNNNLSDPITVIVISRDSGSYTAQPSLEFIQFEPSNDNYNVILNNGSYTVDTVNGQITIPSDGLFEISINNSSIQSMGAQTGLLFVWHINNEPYYINNTPGDFKPTVISYGIVTESPINDLLYCSALNNTQYTYLNKGDVLDIRCQTVTAGPRTVNMNNIIIKVKKIN